MQEQKGEERIVAKSKSTAMNLSSHVPAGSSSAKSPIGECEAKDMARSLFTSTVVMKTSSCFSARWFLRISSVSTEPLDLFNELFEGFRDSGKPQAPDHLEALDIPTGPSKNTRGNSNNCPKTRNYPNYALMRVWSLSRKDNTSILLIQKKYKRCNIYAENARCLETKRRLAKGWILKNTRLGPVLDTKGCRNEGRKSIEVLVEISVSRQNRFFGQNREWCWLVRDRIDANQGRRGYSFGETHC